jgi:DNA modification methylase
VGLSDVCCILRSYTEGRYGGEFRDPAWQRARSAAGRCICRPGCDLPPVGPYFALRSYTDAGEHYAGQIGSEATPAEFVDALLAATREMVRVLKPSGSIWVNLGDKYNSAASNQGMGGSTAEGFNGGSMAGKSRPGRGAILAAIRPKSLIGIPWRYALRCIDDLGLILRAEVIWSKPNGLPESVTDRVRRSHETWFHFVTQPRYYSAVDEIREEHKPGQSPAALSFAREGRPTSPGQAFAPHRVGRDDQGLNALGKLPGSVWSIPTQPLQAPAHLGVDHFAAFPMEWPRRIVRGWSPPGICVECGEGWRPSITPAALSDAGQRLLARRNANDNYSAGARGGWDESIRRHQGLSGSERAQLMNPAAITGYACACPEPTAPTRPAVVLDPFGGTGTTALVAHALGRHGISVDMSGDYCRLARWRTTDPGQVAAAMQVEKPPSADHGTDDLLTLLEDDPGVAL